MAVRYIKTSETITSHRLRITQQSLLVAINNMLFENGENFTIPDNVQLSLENQDANFERQLVIEWSEQ